MSVPISCFRTHTHIILYKIWFYACFIIIPVLHLFYFCFTPTSYLLITCFTPVLLTSVLNLFYTYFTYTCFTSVPISVSGPLLIYILTKFGFTPVLLLQLFYAFFTPVLHLFQTCLFITCLLPFYTFLHLFTLFYTCLSPAYPYLLFHTCFPHVLTCLHLFTPVLHLFTTSFLPCIINIDEGWYILNNDHSITSFTPVRDPFQHNNTKILKNLD